MPVIKKTGLKDIDLIRQLAHAIWPDAYGKILSSAQLDYMLNLIYSEEALTNQITNLHHQFIIVEENNSAVGFASYSQKNAEESHIFRLHKLYVLTDQQGKGTGKFLLNFILDEITETGAKVLELNVNRQNKAMNFYNRMGFAIAREENIDIGEGYFMNDYVMELKIQH